MTIIRPVTSPLTRSLTAAVTAGGGGFSPLSLFAAGEAGAYFDNSRLDTMFQDAAGTIPAVVDGVVGRQLDLSGRGNHRTQATTASKPILRSSGGLYWLEYDGVDDFLATPSVNFSGIDKMTVWTGLRKQSDAATGVFVGHGIGGTDALAWEIYAPRNAATANYGADIRGGGLNPSARYVGFAAPVTSVLAISYDRAQTTTSNQIVTRINGATQVGEVTTEADVTGNFGAYPIYFGRRGGASIPFSGREYVTIIRGASSTAAQIASAERFVAGKAAVSL